MSPVLKIGAILSLSALAGCEPPQEIWIEVAGPSMAETLLGPHHSATCPACGFGLRWDASNASVPSRATIVCQNCAERIDFEGSPIQPGDRRRLDRQSLRRRPPRRGDIVVAKLRDANSIKRVQGLPGERVEIRDGDLIVNGVRRTKSLGEFKRVARLLHDDTFRRGNGGTTRDTSARSPRRASINST